MPCHVQCPQPTKMSDFGDLSSQQQRQDSETSPYDAEVSSLFSDMSCDASDSDSPTTDDYEEDIYFDLSNISKKEELSDTDPQEYEDSVDFDYYQKHIERKIRIQNRSKIGKLQKRRARENPGKNPGKNIFLCPAKNFLNLLKSHKNSMLSVRLAGLDLAY